MSLHVYVSRWLLCSLSSVVLANQYFLSADVFVGVGVYVCMYVVGHRLTVWVVIAANITNY